MQTLIETVIIVPAAVFTGVVVFLSTVLRQAFDDLPPDVYQRVYGLVIRVGRRSVTIWSLVLLPVVALTAHLALGYGDALVVAGTLVYVAGAIVASRLVNEPLYTRLLDADPEDVAEVSRVRTLLHRANGTRAVVSLVGVAVVAVGVG